MKTKTNWKNHLIELIVVFLGITAAFTLNSWKENSNKTELKEEYIKSFIQDLEEDKNKLENLIKFENDKIIRFTNYLNQAGSIKDWDKDSLVIIISDMMRLNAFIPSNVTYETIKNSGQMVLFSDYSQKRAIVNYYQMCEGLKYQESINFDWINDYGLPFVNKNLDFQKLTFTKKFDSVSLEFKNLIFGHQLQLKSKIELYKRQLIELEKFRNILNSK